MNGILKKKFYKTKQLLEKIIEENHTKPEDVVQMLLSATPDLHAVFPAKAVRELSGWQYVPEHVCRKWT